MILGRSFFDFRRVAVICLGLALVAGLLSGLATAQDDDVLPIDESLQRSSDLTVTMPPMNATEGRILFATKGCVICHEVNGVGGRRGKAPALDAARMPIEPDPFVFAARMWRGAKQMITLQEEDLGYRIQITPQELAHLFAFVHDEDEQKSFTLPGRTVQ